MGIDDGRSAPQAGPVPAWITVPEAAFLSSRDRRAIEASVEEGAVRTRRIGSAVLVSSEDVFRWSPDEAKASSVAPERSRPRRLRAWLGASMGLALVASLLVRQQLTRRDLDRGSVRPSLAVRSAGEVTTGSAPTSVREIRPPGRKGRPLRVGDLEWVRRGGWLTAGVMIAQPNRGWWLARAEVVFVVSDDAGHIVANYRTPTSVPPGKGSVVVAPALLLEDGVRLGPIDLQVLAPTWRPADAYRRRGDELLVSQVHVGRGGRVDGRLSIGGAGEVATATVSCLLRRGNALAGMVVASADLTGGRSARFSALAPFLATTPDRATCGAVPAG